MVEEGATTGQRAADWVARTVGSWRFIIVQSLLLTLWVILNVMAWLRHWDPYPFILMNLVLSLQAAYTAPVIMMSQNRQARRDRIEAHHDFLIDQKAELEIRAVLTHLEVQDQALTLALQELNALRKELSRLTASSTAGAPVAEHSPDHDPAAPAGSADAS
jgi:uncharacterized membrane protein